MKELVISQVRFEEESHRYFLGEKELQGVTSTLINRAFPDKYKGVSQKKLDDAKKKGKDLHSAIEFHDRFNTDADKEEDPRVASYEYLKGSRDLCTIANEYLVSDNERYASSIDMVMVNGNDEICLADLKTCYDLDRASTGLQLSIYKRFFEMQNPDLEVKHIFVIWLPNKDMTIAEIHELSVVDDETLDALFEADAKDEPFEFNAIPDGWSDLEGEYLLWAAKQAEAEAHIAEVKQKMMEFMQTSDINIIKTGASTVSYIPAKTSKRFDSAAFKKDNALLYNAYMKESETAASIRILKK